jgi:hypothetical protein
MPVNTIPRVACGTLRASCRTQGVTHGCVSGEARTGVPGRRLAGAEGGRRQRCRLRLHRTQGRDQRAQFRRPEFRCEDRRRRHPLCARSWAQGAVRHQYLRAGEGPGALARRGRPRCRARCGCRDPGRHGAARLRREDASRAAFAPVGAGFGDQLRSGELLPRDVRCAASRAAARADDPAGRARDRTHAGRDRGVRFRQPVRDGRGALRCCLPTQPASRRIPMVCAVRRVPCVGRRASRGWRAG